MRFVFIFGAVWTALAPHANAQINAALKDTPKPEDPADRARDRADTSRFSGAAGDALFNLDLEGQIIAEGMDAQIGDGGVRLPLGQLSSALELPITVDPSAGRASGWFIAKERTFELDIGAGKATSGGKTFTIPPGGVTRTDTDILVDTSLLSQWLPLDFDISIDNLQISIDPREKLPAQLRTEREAAREQLFARFGPENDLTPEDTIAPMPYRALSLPFLSVAANAGYGSDSGEEYGYDIRASGEVAWMTARLAVSGDQAEGVQSARFSLGREDPLGHLPLGLRRFEVGDTYTPSAPLISRGNGGAGFSFSNAPLTQPDKFDTTTLRGDLPAGYDVELYRNGVLLNSQASREDGRYEFPDVPLEFGDNELRLVFYSPTGETRQEVRNVNVGQNQVKKGDVHYSVGATVQNQFLLTDNTFGQISPGDGEVRAVAQAEVGVAQNLSLSGTLAAIPVAEGDTRALAGVGANLGLGGMSVRVDAAASSEKGWAFEAGVVGDLFGATLALDHAELADGFLSDENLTSEPGLRRRTGARVNFTVPIAGHGLQTALSVRRLERNATPAELETTLRTTLPLGNSVLVSNSLRFRDFGNGSTFEGETDVNAQFMNWLMRASLNYQTGDQGGVRSIGLQADRHFGPDASLRLGASHDFAGGSRLAADYTHRLRTADLSLGASYDTGNSDFRMVASIRFGIGRDSAAKRWIVTPQSLADAGVVRANLYVDRNGDGRRGAGEDALEGVEVSLGGGQRAVSNAKGQAILTGEPGRPSLLHIELASLPDPYMLPARDRVGVVPRPGTIGIVDLPVIQTGALEGVTLYASDLGQRPVGNVALELVDAQGRLAASTRSQFDGAYSFDLVRPGKYTLRLERERAAELGVRLRDDPEIEVGPDGAIVRGVRLVIEAAPKPFVEEARAVPVGIPGATPAPVPVAANASWSALTATDAEKRRRALAAREPGKVQPLPVAAPILTSASGPLDRLGQAQSVLPGTQVVIVRSPEPARPAPRLITIAAGPERAPALVPPVASQPSSQGSWMRLFEGARATPPSFASAEKASAGGSTPAETPAPTAGARP